MSLSSSPFFLRKERELLKEVDSAERMQLLQKVAEHDEEFFDWAIKSLM